jgi:hypothetical protein
MFRANSRCLISSNVGMQVNVFALMDLRAHFLNQPKMSMFFVKVMVNSGETTIFHTISAINASPTTNRFWRVITELLPGTVNLK